MKELARPYPGLVQWVTQNGGLLHDHVEIVYDAERGSHARVRPGNRVPSGTRIAACPMSASLSVLNALDVAPFGSHGTRFPRDFIGKQSWTVVQYFFLMEQWILGKKSWWAPYIATLPRPSEIDSLCFATQEDLRWIVATNLSSAFAKQTEMWQGMYSAASDQLRTLHWPSAVNNLYTWELFIWAATMFGSRSFTSQVLSDTLPADKARPIGSDHPDHEELSQLFSRGFPVLLPLLDILNHKPMARVEWQARVSFVGLQILEPYHGGQEICNNYGPRDNETLMVGYGFALPSNPFDHFTVGLKAPPGSPVADIRAWQSKSEKDCKYYIFNHDHPKSRSASALESSVFSLDLLEAISVLSANDRELQAMYETRRTLISDGLAKGRLEDCHNLLNTIAQLRTECLARTKILWSTDPTNTPSPSIPTSSKQRYAKIYRDSQLLILRTATRLCDYALIRARTALSQDEIIALMHGHGAANHLYDTAVTNLEALLERQPSVIRQQELFMFSDVTGLLSDHLARTVRRVCAAAWTSTRDWMTSRSPEPADGRFHYGLPKIELYKLRFAVFLAFCLARSPDDPQSLPFRLQRWMQTLTGWYPPDDPSWSAPPPELQGDDGDTTSISMLQALLMATKGSTKGSDSHTNMTWCDAEKLSWAWNVVEEEGVYLSTGMPALRDPLDGGSGLDGEYLLYIPRV